MVVRNGTNCVELSEIILVRSVVSMPSDYVERRMMSLKFKELALELVDDSPLFIFVFIPSDWDFEVSWVCKTISSNGSKIRNHEMSLVYLTNETSGCSV